jgi:hypothetical protein
MIQIDINPSGDTTADLQNYRTTNGITWPLALDVGLTVSTAYGVDAAPWTFIIDTTGTIQKDFRGLADNATMIDEIAKWIEIPTLPKTIESSDSMGVTKDTFNLSDDVYGTGVNYTASTTYDVYVVSDVTWVDGMTIPARVPGTATTVSSDASGNITPTLLWSHPLTPGKYDVVVDVNSNGLYNVGIDALDNNDVQVTAGLLVIPEMYPGSILGLAACFATFSIFLVRKRKLL